MLKGLDPDHSVGSDQGPNCVQSKVISRQQKSLLARKVNVKQHKDSIFKNEHFV